MLFSFYVYIFSIFYQIIIEFNYIRMKYWLIAIAIIIIIACLIYSYNNVIEGLDETEDPEPEPEPEPEMIKYYEDTSRIDNMIRMITMKITELRMTLPNNYVNRLTPEYVTGLEDERNAALKELTDIQTTMEQNKGSQVKMTAKQEKENQDKIDKLNQTIDEITDALSIIRYKSQVDYLDNAKTILAKQYNKYYYETKIEIIQEKLDDKTNKLSDKERTEKQTEIDNYKLDIKSAEAIIEERKTENEAKLKTDADLKDGSKVYVPLQNMIDGNSSSSGSDPATTYDIPVDENGKFDPSKFYDYISDDAEKIAIDENKGTWVKDKDGKMVQLDLGDISPTGVNYYEPGSYKYDSGLYVPSYQDSVYLSKTTGKHTAAEYLDMASLAGGICSHYKDQPEKLEEECAKLDKNICGSTSCCALFGGSKCVAGNAQGPISRLNYDDITVKNRDFYYYKGKCYGNCVSQSTTSTDAGTDIVVAANPTGTVPNGANNNNGNTSTKV
jgi:hypothetical protein